MGYWDEAWATGMRPGLLVWAMEYWSGPWCTGQCLPRCTGQCLPRCTGTGVDQHEHHDGGTGTGAHDTIDGSEARAMDWWDGLCPSRSRTTWLRPRSIDKAQVY